CGGVVSTTVTTCWQVALLEHESVAFQVRVAVRVEPHVAFVMVLTMVMETLVPLQTSVAEGGSKLQAVPHWTDLLATQVICGGVVSTTVTSCWQVALLEHES